MNILLYDCLNAFLRPDIETTLKEMGHKFKSILHKIGDYYDDESVMSEVDKELTENDFDLVLTINFFPAVAKVCYKHDTPYKSWCYDAPMNLPVEEGFEFPTNAIYTFDREDCLKYRRMGYDTVYHLALATNTNRLNKFRSDYVKYGCDISFIGQLYESTLPALKAEMNEHDKGYLEGVIAAQRRVYGSYFVPDLINEKFAESVRNTYLSKSSDTWLPHRLELAFHTSMYITQVERVGLLRFASRIGETKLYTEKLSEEVARLLPGIKISGYVDYWKQFPIAVKSCKINLCPLLRNIKSGIPLRVLDIMGCNSFALTSFQPELAENFTEGKDVVMYTSIEEANDKMRYYLQHEGERKHIAAAGYERVKNDYRFDKALRIILGEEPLPTQPRV